MTHAKAQVQRKCRSNEILLSLRFRLCVSLAVFRFQRCFTCTTQRGGGSAWRGFCCSACCPRCWSAAGARAGICRAAREPKLENLAAQLGLDVKLDALSYLRPGAVLYEGVELSDPETGQTLLRCRLLEVAWQEQTDEQGQRRPTLSMVASQPQVEAAALRPTWRWLQNLLASQLGRLDDRRPALRRRGDAARRGRLANPQRRGRARRGAAGRDARPTPFPAGRRRHARAGPHPPGPQPPGLAAA